MFSGLRAQFPVEDFWCWSPTWTNSSRTGMLWVVHVKKKKASLELPITYGEWRERAIWSYGYSYSHIFPIQWGAVWSYQEFPKHILVTHCLFHIYFISVKFVGYNTIQSWLHQSYCHSWCHGCIMLPSLIGSLKRLPIPTSNQPSLATTGNQASNMRFHQHVLWSLSGMTLIYHR